MIVSPDAINALFQVLGAFIVLLNVYRVYRDKIVRGVDWRVTAFFVAWGLWNMYYWPHLGQWLSFWAGVAMTLSNLVYLGLMLFYITTEDDRYV